MLKHNKNLISGKSSASKKWLIDPSFPRKISVSLGEYGCGYSCKMCPQGYPENRKINAEPREMSLLTFKKIIEQIPDKEEIYFELCASGDLLTFKTLEDYIKYFKDRKPKSKIIIETNGRLLNNERSLKIINSGLDVLVFSLDAANKESYKRLTGSDEYETACANLEGLVRARNSLGAARPLIEVTMLKIAQLSEEIPSFVKRWSKIADFTDIRAPGNWGGLIDEAQCSSLEKLPPKRYPCLYLWYAVKIMSGGDIVKCLVDSYAAPCALGNVNRDSLADIWRSERLNQIRQNHLNCQFEKVSSCERCNFWSLFPNLFKWDKKEGVWRL